MLTIGQLAKQTDNNTVTIRYYEKCGLIPASRRSGGGYRLYPESIIPRFRFIKNAKMVGFTLDEIKELLTLQHLPQSKGQQIKDVTLSKIVEIKIKVKALQKMQRALEHLTVACDGKMPVQECPILEALYAENKTELASFLQIKQKGKIHEQCHLHSRAKGRRQH